MPIEHSSLAQNLLKRASYSPPYRSPYGPQYAIATHYHGWTLGKLTKFGTIAGGFGAAAGVFVLFFFGEIPRFQKDVLRRLPFLDTYFDRTVPPEDQPF